MTVIDAGISAVLVFFVAWGFWVGFIRQLAVVVALVVAFVVAGSYAGEFLLLVEPYVDPSRLTFILAYLLLAAMTYLLVRVLALGLRGLVTFAMTSWFDRISGGGLGLVKAYLLLVLVYFLFSGVATPVEPVLEESYFKPYLETGVHQVQKLVRDEQLRDIFIPEQPAISVEIPIPGDPPR